MTLFWLFSATLFGYFSTLFDSFFDFLGYSLALFDSFSGFRGFFFFKKCKMDTWKTNRKRFWTLFWLSLANFGQLLTLFRQFLTISDLVWRVLTIPDHVWWNLTLFWQILTIFENFWCLLTFFWLFMATFAASWHFSDDFWHFLTLFDTLFDDSWHFLTLFDNSWQFLNLAITSCELLAIIWCDT